MCKREHTFGKILRDATALSLIRENMRKPFKCGNIPNPSYSAEKPKNIKKEKKKHSLRINLNHAHHHRSDSFDSKRRGSGRGARGHKNVDMT